MSDVHGIFDVDSFVTLFYDADLSEEADIVDIINEKFHIQRNEEAFKINSIYSIPENYLLNFLHEEIHYWQAMSSPAIILNFLNISQLLFVQSDKLNLRHVVTNCFPFEQETDIDFYRYVYRSHRMNFEAPREGMELYRQITSLYKNSQQQGFDGSWYEFTSFLKKRTEEASGVNIYAFNAPYLHLVKDSYNVVSDNPPLAMPFMIMPHLQHGKEFIAYAGILDYYDTVYFTGDNLMESFAVVNDYLAKGEPIPKYEASKGESNRYLGVYECYRRMHNHRYPDEKQLAISFLALVDICFTTDPLHNHNEDYKNDENFRQENVSIPYRFGKLMFRAQGFRPFSISDETKIEDEIEKWQDDFCSYQGLYLPNLCIKHTIEELLIILIFDFEGLGYELPHELVELAGNFHAKEPDWERKLDLIVSHINQLYKKHLGRSPGSGLSLQNHMILAMSNAMIYKLKNRGKMVISGIYNEQIRWAIEPGLYIFGSKYAFNQLAAVRRGPLNDYSTGVYTPIELLTVKTMAIEGIRSCGFKESFYPCRYVSNGWGCPLVGLTEEEKAKRRRNGFPENWCHYTRVMNILDRERWKN